jgi:hypothetical protein
MIPGVQLDMEGCPPEDVNLLYMTLSALIGLTMFLIYQTVKKFVLDAQKQQKMSKKNKLKDDEFRDLQIELYGEERLKDSLSGTSHSARSGTAKKQVTSHPAVATVKQVDVEKPAVVDEEMCA